MDKHYFKKGSIMRKRILAIICVVFVIISAISLNAFATLPTTMYFRALFNSTVRSGQGTSYANLGQANIGTIQTGVHSSYGYKYNINKWTQIVWGNGTGYIRNDLVCPDNVIFRVHVTTNAHIRSEHEIDPNNIVCSVPNNIVLEQISDTIYVDADNYSWFEVRVRTGSNEGDTGWIRRDLMTKGY